MTYDFYDAMNSINTINYLGNLYVHIMKAGWKKSDTHSCFGEIQYDLLCSIGSS
jgi:hypothetical protein